MLLSPTYESVGIGKRGYLVSPYMRRLWQSAKYKAYNRKRVERSIKRLRKANKKRKTKVGLQRWVSGEGIYKPLQAPEIFSFSKNGLETVEYFAQMEQRFELSQPTFVDLERVKEMTPDAIMYLLSLMDVYSQQEFVKVRGNKPLKPKPRELLEESGFFDFVNTREPVIRHNTKVLSIQTGELVESKVAEEVVNFARRCLNRERDSVSAGTYTNLLECMGNTKGHAYTQNLPYKPKWWLVAVHDETKRCVSFTILDYGLGIPTTVRKTLLEQAARFLDSVSISSKYSIDHYLVNSALRGELRTRTGVKYRGKGLPRIYSNHNRQLTENLVVVSDKAYVNLGSGELLDLSTPLQGTVLSWDYVAYDREENESA